MLLIDGVRYQEWTPTNEEELEQMVKEHAQEIFGENSIYLDIKHKLTSKSGVGSIPDGYVIVFSNPLQWHVVEVELSSHPLHEHIVSQIGRFVSGIKNPSTQSNNIVDMIYGEIKGDDFLNTRVRKEIGSEEIHKYLSDCISKPPTVTIIIEKETPELGEALDAINHPQKRVVEFQTFTREGVGLAVHAHLFEPLFQAPILVVQLLDRVPPSPPPGPGGKAGRVTFAELVSAGLLKDGQVLYFFNGRVYKDEKARVVASENRLRYEVDSNTYSPSRLAEILFEKYGFNYVALRGPNYWITEDEKLLVDLHEKIRAVRGDRK